MSKRLVLLLFALVVVAMLTVGGVALAQQDWEQGMRESFIAQTPRGESPPQIYINGQ